jgi:hypothetical protein
MLHRLDMTRSLLGRPVSKAATRPRQVTSPFELTLAARHDGSMKWFLSATLLVAVGATLAACGIERPDILRNTGLGDRCADYMRLSYPGAKIAVTIRHVEASTTESGGLGLMIIDVDGVRPDIPVTGGFLARDIAARCRFENSVLTQFRWTKGPSR